MKDVYKILFLSDEYNCFFHLNRKKLKEFCSLGSFNNCIKVEFVKDLSLFTYSFLSNCDIAQLGDNQIGVCAVYAQSLGLKEEDEVLISGENAMSLTRVNVVPRNQNDYELVMRNMNHLENVILNQLRIVTLGQSIPIHLRSNISIVVKVESLEPEAQFGELQQCTEFVVVDPSEIPKIDFVAPHKSSEPSAVKEANQLEHLNFEDISYWRSARMDNEAGDQSQRRFLSISSIMRMFRQFWKGENTQESVSVDKAYTPRLCSIEDDAVYRVNSTLLIEDDLPKKVSEKCIIVKKLPVPKSADGPCSFKIFCKVIKVEENMENFSYDLRVDYYTFAYVVQMSDSEEEEEPGRHRDKDIYCPDFIMRILNLRIGSYVYIEEVARKTDYMDENRANSMIRTSIYNTNHNMLTEEMKNIYDSAIATVISNMKYKEKMNTLIVGGTGTGKSYLVNSLMIFMEDKSLFCRKVECKKLRKMKPQSLVKLFTETLCECCSTQPSILFIDDMDALLTAEEEDNTLYKSLYSERIGDLLTSLFSSYQKLNQVSIVATIRSMSKIKHMSTDRGPIMFDNICKIPDLTAPERADILKHLISEKYPTQDVSFIEYVSGKTKGYTIQDLYDLVDMAAFKALGQYKPGGFELDKTDFELALAEKVPLALHGVNLSKNTRVDWSDIGGMREPKRVLREMFEWPIKYREVYQSCPLRLPCGILLYGAPGTGKTLIASAVASECGLNFISVKGPEIFSKYVGASEQGIRDLFTRAKKAKPCLLFFDEFDSLAPRRGSSNEDVNDRVVNQILTELDGVEELSEVFVLAATSRPDLLDPALLRPGRIDKTIHCELPGKDDRVSILKALSKTLPLSDDVNFEDIASKTDGYTGADLQAVLYAAQTILIKQVEKKTDNSSPEPLKLKHSFLLAGLAQTQPSLSKKEKLKYQSLYENFVSSRMGGTVLQRREPQEPVQQIMFA